MTANTADLAAGVVETRDGEHVSRYERRLEHSVERVWAAITEPQRLVGWLAEADVELREGGAVELRWQNTDNEGGQTVARGTVTELRPPLVVEYDTDVHGRLRFELVGDGAGTLLRFTVALPAPDDSLSLTLAGWQIHLDHLVAALDGEPVDWPSWDREHRPTWALYEARHQEQLS